MPALEKWIPFPELDMMERRMRRMFEDFGLAPALAPAADVYETTDEYVVELEVPGFDEKQLAIELSDHTLTVKGERKEEVSTKEKTPRLRERLESTFQRRFQLPYDTDSEHLTAAYSKGLLTLHVPKTETHKPRRVEIATK
jgi:HSP20 family protein